MDKLNRVLLIIISALAAVASLVGLLVASGTLTLGQVQSAIPYQRIADFYQANFVAATLVSILLLGFLLALGVLWLKGQYADSVRAIVGGEYQAQADEHGDTFVDYDAVERAIDNSISRMPGVINTATQIYSGRGGRLIAHTALEVKRTANIHHVDNRIRRTINREWLQRFGINLNRHDVTINIEPVEKRVA